MKLMLDGGREAVLEVATNDWVSTPRSGIALQSPAGIFLNRTFEDVCTGSEKPAMVWYEDLPVVGGRSPIAIIKGLSLAPIMGISFCVYFCRCKHIAGYV
eukprot:TRINITY_DN10888_c0_g1_i1.p1 TRINITY_DN10888_c0_g1~~TRINITY_DN10888_c0_g1_i1.p1  ORF type:complete len:100 (-),score=9.08 TRINITY_DN10888_c0_g1_i1:534-833(-)